MERAKSSPQAGTQRSGISSGEGKHRVRLYAVRIYRGYAPAPPALKGDPTATQRSGCGGERRSKGERNSIQKKKTEIVTARMTPEVKRQLQARARDANMTLTNYLIICGLGQEIVRVEGLDDLLSELKAQGRNLNQLTTLANMGKLKILRGDDLVNGYAKLCEQVSRLIGEVK